MADKIRSYQLSFENDIEGIFRHQTDGVDGEEATHLAEEGKLSELPERHVQSRRQCKSPNLKIIQSGHPNILIFLIPFLDMLLRTETYELSSHNPSPPPSQGRDVIDRLSLE